MIVSALLDTSYLITLVNKNRANHVVAASYYRHMLIHKVRMYVSTIAISEFAVKQNPSELPLNHFLLLRPSRVRKYSLYLYRRPQYVSEMVRPTACEIPH